MSAVPAEDLFDTLAPVLRVKPVIEAFCRFGGAWRSARGTSGTGWNHDVANPRSRITSDGHPRRRKLLSHGRVAKSFPGGTVGISGPAVPVAPRSGREPPKSTARDLTRVRFQSCRVCGASYYAILAIPGRPLTRGRPKGQLNPAGFLFLLSPGAVSPLFKQRL